MRKFVAIVSAAALGLIGLFALSAPAQAVTDGENEFIAWTVGCGEVTFTNLTDATVYVAYGLFGTENPDDDFELGPNGSHTISTDREWLDFLAGYDPAGDDHIEGGTDVPQECKETGPSKTKKPKVAPAAGI